MVTWYFVDKIKVVSGAIKIWQKNVYVILASFSQYVCKVHSKGNFGVKPLGCFSINRYYYFTSVKSCKTEFIESKLEAT